MTLSRGGVSDHSVIDDIVMETYTALLIMEIYV